MPAVIYINCSSAPFIDMITENLKPLETRSRDTLRALLGQRVMLAETDRHGPSMVRASARIVYVFPVLTSEAWNRLRPLHQVPAGSRYDWKPDTRIKYLYRLEDVRKLDPFPVPEGVRHGRVWLEY